MSLGYPEDFWDLSAAEQEAWFTAHPDFFIGLGDEEWGGPRASTDNGHAADDALPPPEFSEDALALEFADKHYARLRYVAIWGKWFAWNDSHWEPENTLAVFDLARKICRAAAARCDKPSVAAAISKARTVAAVELFAKSDRRISARKDQWDAGQYLLNTPGGIVDLKTGIMRPCDPEAYCTKITAVAPADAADCPTFLKFLDEITLGDGSYIAYLQRLFGYCLTGDTCEHVMAFAHGPGGGGKSTLFATIGGVMGDYRTTAPMETFVQTSQREHYTELAGLMGARMVTASETEEGRRWAEAKIKNLTGGDQISARFMHKDFFTFTPQFKLVIFGNHRPSLRSVDEAIRRRFHLLPFPKSIPEGQRDLGLPGRLRAEGPGILRWMITGCLEWQRTGLCPPRAVVDATRDYLSAEDNVWFWIEECCTVAPNEQESSGALYASWKRRAEDSGVAAGTEQSLVQAIKERLGDNVAETKNIRDFGGRKRGLIGISINRNDFNEQGSYG